MIIDQLTAIPSPQSSDELPIERGQLTYKITWDDLAGTDIGNLKSDMTEAQDDITTIQDDIGTVQGDIGTITDDVDELKTSIIQSSAYAVTANGTTSHSLTGLTADHVVGNWGMFTDSGLTTPIPENAPTCDIQITTSSGSWSITVTNFTATFYIAPTFIKD